MTAEEREHSLHSSLTTRENQCSKNMQTDTHTHTHDTDRRTNGQLPRVVLDMQSPQMHKCCTYMHVNTHMPADVSGPHARAKPFTNAAGGRSYGRPFQTRFRGGKKVKLHFCRTPLKLSRGTRSITTTASNQIS